MERNKRSALAAVSTLVLLFGLVGLQALKTGGISGAFAGGGSLHMPFIPHNMLGGVGLVQGYVVDAITGEGIDGAEVQTEYGDFFTTGTQGFYTIPNIPLGYRQFTAAADTGAVQYSDLTRGIQVKGGPANILNFALSPDDLEGVGEFRIVVSWGDDPADLDAHLWTPDNILYDANNNGILDPGESRPHIYSEHRGHCDDPPGMVFDQSSVCLERDEREGFGPETIKINETTPNSTYYFAVHRFEPACYPGPVPCPTPLEESGAIVQVYDESGLQLFKVVPSFNPNGKFVWFVFEMVIDSTGQFQQFNEKDCFIDLPAMIDDPPMCPP